jgi:hypothetical protein
MFGSFTWWFACDYRSERGEEVPRINFPRPIQISCSTFFYGKREAEFRGD